MLSFAAAQLRVGARPTELATENLLRPETPTRRYRHYFKREALHDLVWTAPVSEIAERLGVSDVGLAKLCRRAAIPRPGRGYWARVEAGQRIERTALPPPPEDLPELLRIRGAKQIPSAISAAA